MTTSGRVRRAFAHGLAVAAITVLASTARPTGLSGQTELRYDVGLGAGFFIDLPGPFQEQYCEANAAGLGGSLGWRLLDWLVLEGSALITGQLGGETCAIPGLAPLPRDTPIVETFYDQSVQGVDFFATHAAAVVEPFRGWPVSPRVRGGVGWIWQKNLLDWNWGAGVVYRFGRYAFSTDVEWWNVAIDELQETVIYRTGGGRELQSSQTVTRTYRPWLVRIGLEFEFPR